jgi:transcriptional regulator with XRE-family HTH domain
MTSTATEDLPQMVAERLRQQMGGRRINQRKLGELTGWTAMYVHRRYTGETPLDVKDLAVIHAATGISPALLLTGYEEQRSDNRRVSAPVEPPPPRRRKARRRSPNVNDSALAYLRLAEPLLIDDQPPLLLPRLDSNQEPSGLFHYPELPAVSGF